MSRRDTIVVAVLINVGLLLVLFASAVRTDKAGTASSASSAEMAKAVPVEESIAMPELENDEMDEILDQFSQHLSLEREPKKESTSGTRIPLIGEERSSRGQATQVIVRQGDYMEKLAEENGTTVEEILAFNHLPDTNLRVGQVLRIPLTATLQKQAPKKSPVVKQRKVSPERVQEVKAQPKQDDSEYYVIRSGDNPWLIALKYHIDLQKLLKINGLDEKSARRLKPGDRIKIR